MELSKEALDYFKRGEHENPTFWFRLGGMPPLQGVSVLDVGCGYGRLCIDMALVGAKKVVGIDINSHMINFADENLRQNYPQLKSIVEFKNTNLKDYNKEGNLFDYIVSKDSFEHIMNLDEVLSEMKRSLKRGGRVYAGFGTLYNSPLGDHGRTKTLIPWGHLLIPERIIISRLNRRRSKKISSIYDLGLNKMSLSDYRKVIYESGFSVVFFAVNQNKRIISRIFTMFSRIPFLEEYFSHNIYCILEKPK